MTVCLLWARCLLVGHLFSTAGAFYGLVLGIITPQAGRVVRVQGKHSLIEAHSYLFHELLLYTVTKAGVAVACWAVVCGAPLRRAVVCGAVVCGAVVCGAVVCGAVVCGGLVYGAVACGAAVVCGAQSFLPSEVIKKTA